MKVGYQYSLMVCFQRRNGTISTDKIHIASTLSCQMRIIFYRWFYLLEKQNVLSKFSNIYARPPYNE